ncbi:MAG: hypothetical protein H0V02_08565 [Nocardioidaceae bacterium]|nr:hypothetical protein [Nocardioidaceae bacterium]
MSRRVYIHVGLPKTGTSYVQRALWRNKDRLAEHAIALPGETQQFQRRGVWDLMGRRLEGGDQPLIPGSWQTLVDDIHDGADETAILSEEFLVHARPAQARKIVRDLNPAEVHIVVTVRDLTRVIGSMWQHEVSQGATWPWSEFVAAVHNPKQGPPTAGVGFWLRYDLRRVLDVWEAAVPAQRIHIVVVPTSSAPPTRLLELFAQATNIEDVALTPPDQIANTSVGVIETEVLRRLNAGLDGRLNERQYLWVLDHALKPALRARGGSSRLRIPDEYHAWLSARSSEMMHFLLASDYHVVGDVEDLLSAGSALDGVDPGELDDHDPLEAAMSALTGITEHYANYWWKVRKRKDVDEAKTLTQLVSSGRALGFRARTKAFELADRNRLLAHAARTYLRRRSRHI